MAAVPNGKSCKLSKMGCQHLDYPLCWDPFSSLVDDPSSPIYSSCAHRSGPILKKLRPRVEHEARNLILGLCAHTFNPKRFERSKCISPICARACVTRFIRKRWTCSVMRATLMALAAGHASLRYPDASLIMRRPPAHAAAAK